jgi:Zn-dependent membrane protease YugP
MFGFDPIQLAIMGVGMVLSLGATAYVRYQFGKGKEVPLRSGRSGADIARAILRHNDVYDVEVVEHQGFLSDHYDPTHKKLALSPDVYHGTHAAAAGVAAHEVGHALQHAQGDITMWGRTILVYPAHFGSMLAPWLIIAGLFLAGARGLVEGSLAHTLAWVGVYGFGVAVLCSLIIVANEFNASKRAKEALIAMGITGRGEENDAVGSVLTAAGLTYVAAALTAALQMAYWVMVVMNSRREE